jgi:tRNA pseudouridine55 synthase
MTVSSGFYVRSLAHDLGLALGSNAIMSSLERTRQGDFDISPENIIQYKDLDGGEEVWGPKLQGFLDKWASREAAHKTQEEEGDEREAEGRKRRANTSSDED